MIDTVIGHGTHRYRVVPGWGQLDPAKTPLLDAHEMAMDRRGRIILLTNDVANNVIVYDKAGRLLEAWGHDYPGAHGLTHWDEDGEEFLFVCDTERAIVDKLTLDGRLVMRLGCPVETGLYAGEARFRPSGTAIAPNGDIYVTDGYGESWIFQFSPRGELIRHFGGKGERPEQFRFAHGCCIDRRVAGEPQLIVCERMRHVFKRFTLDGRFLADIPLPGAFLSRPVIHDQHLYSAVLLSREPWDSKSGFVTIVGPDDRCVSNPGGSEPVYVDGALEQLTQVGGTFMSPHDVLVDDEGDLYVAQWQSNRTYPIKLARLR
jgi:hypothetical protein